MNQIQKAFVNVGLRTEKNLPKQKKRKNKVQKCYKCGSIMEYVDDTNILVCPNDKCSNYYLFKNTVK